MKTRCLKFQRKSCEDADGKACQGQTFLQLQKLVNCGRKKSYKIGPWCNITMELIGPIYNLQRRLSIEIIAPKAKCSYKWVQ